jgi:hypothetical protein
VCRSLSSHPQVLLCRTNLCELILVCFPLRCVATRPVLLQRAAGLTVGTHQRSPRSLAEAVVEHVTKPLRQLFTEARLSRCVLRDVAAVLSSDVDTVDEEMWVRQLEVIGGCFSASPSRVHDLVQAMKDVLLESECGDILRTLQELGVRRRPEDQEDPMAAQLQALALAGTKADETVAVGGGGHLAATLQGLRSLSAGQLGLLSNGFRYAPIMNWLRSQELFSMDITQHIDMMTAKQQVGALHCGRSIATASLVLNGNGYGAVLSSLPSGERSLVCPVPFPFPVPSQTIPLFLPQIRLCVWLVPPRCRCTA